MIRSLYTATSGMRAQQHKIDSIGNNIANISTIGYKRSEPNFKETLYDVMENRPTGAGGPLLAGNGTRVGSVKTYFTQGVLQSTDYNLDIGLQGSGFFAIGVEDGEEFYTKDGSFKISNLSNGQARLDNKEGYPVLDRYGQPFLFNGSIGEDDILIAEDGTLYLKDGNDNIVYQGTLGIYSFTDTSGLEPVRGSYFRATQASGQPTELEDTIVKQGYLEHSNVDMAKEMTDLIVAQRAYQLNSRVLQTADEMEKQTNNLKG